jgi:hypothetical protein
MIRTARSLRNRYFRNSSQHYRYSADGPVLAGPPCEDVLCRLLQGALAVLIGAPQGAAFEMLRRDPSGPVAARAGDFEIPRGLGLLAARELEPCVEPSARKGPEALDDRERPASSLWLGLPCRPISF